MPSASSQLAPFTFLLWNSAPSWAHFFTCLQCWLSSLLHASFFWAWEGSMCLSCHPCFSVLLPDHSLMSPWPSRPSGNEDIWLHDYVVVTYRPSLLGDFSPRYCLNFQCSSCQYFRWFQYPNRLPFLYQPLDSFQDLIFHHLSHPFRCSRPRPSFTSNCFPFSSVPLTNYCVFPFQFTLPGTLLQQLSESSKPSSVITTPLCYEHRPHDLSDCLSGLEAQGILLPPFPCLHHQLPLFFSLSHACLEKPEPWFCPVADLRLRVEKPHNHAVTDCWFTALVILSLSLQQHHHFPSVGSSSPSSSSFPFPSSSSSPSPCPPSSFLFFLLWHGKAEMIEVVCVSVCGYGRDLSMNLSIYSLRP